MKILVFILVSLMMFGCATTSKDSESFMDVLDVTLSSAEGAQSQKNDLYNLILEALHEGNRFEADPHPGRDGGRYSRWERRGGRDFDGRKNGLLVYRGGTNMDYQYSYFIDANNRLIKNTLNYDWYNTPMKDCFLCLDNGFTEYSDALAFKAAGIYNKFITEYLAAVKRNKDIAIALQDFLEKVNVGTNNSLPINYKYLKVIESRVRKEVYSGDVVFSLDNGIQVYEPSIKLTLSPAHLIGRLGVTTELSNDSIKLGSDPAVSVVVTDGFYDLLPDIFLAENDDISIVLEKGMLNITNKTNKFIKIDSFTVYAGTKVDTLNSMNISLPPQAFISEKVLNSFDILQSLVEPRIISLKRPLDRFEFGIAISYFDSGDNKYNTLLERKVFSMQDFER